MQNKNKNQIPKTEGNNISVRIVSQEKQKLSTEIKSMILKAFFKEQKQWKKDSQSKENLEGIFRLTVCEKIEIGMKKDMISIPIEYESNDGGYLHVYGLREIKNW